MTADSMLTLRTPADIVAAVPYLIGFHPQDSLVVVAVRHTKVVLACRQDLPAPDLPVPDGSGADAADVARLVAGHGATTATVIGYGPPGRVTPAAERLAAAVTDAGVAVEEVLRVTGGRWWSYRCVDVGCCPPEGRPCDPAGPVAAAATFAGQVALPDRAALTAQVAAVGGAEREAMVRGTAAAERRLRALLGGAVPGGADGFPVAGPAAAPAPSPAADVGHGDAATGCPVTGSAAARMVLRQAGRAAVAQACRRAAGGGRLSADETAWLGLLVAHVPVRDHAWRRLADQPWQIALWTDVLRRVEPRYVPAPACLLAFAAWRAGRGPLAAVAVERALAHDPAYPMACLLDDVLRHGLPPSALAAWPPPARRVSRR